MQLRIKLISVGFILAISVLSVRLFFWQVVQGEDLATEGRYQLNNSEQILAKRGDILARDGSWLVASVDAWLLYASRPAFEANAKDTAEKLARLFTEQVDFSGPQEDEEEEVDVEKLKKEALEKEEDRLFGLLSNEDLVWIPLKNRVDRALREKIEALEIAGLDFQEEEVRDYPEASSAAHLLGFVGKDDEGADKGYFGLEGYYDLSLGGKHGFKSGEANALGIPIIFGENKESTAIRGASLVTYVDKTIQLIAERQLARGIEKYGALSGNIIVVRPRDGAILAMASLPSYDPDNYFEYGDEFFRNPVISDGFEPGSIFKPIIMAAGIDAGVVEPDTVCDICSGPYKVDKYFIKTWNNEYNPGATMTDVIVRSDNVGMSFVGVRLGADKLYDYLSKFGFGNLTGIDLQGEITPTLREKGTWSIVDLATTSFGQGIAVTPIQMVKALSVIANGGRVATPQVVDKVQIAQSSQDLEPKMGEQVISEETARKVTTMMIAAVKNGEAKWAVPKGFAIAGKTGTAQIPVAGNYDDEKTIASFIGFAPPYNPEFLMLVTLREPTSSPWASETAAPLWFDIARELFPYLGIQPGD